MVGSNNGHNCFSSPKAMQASKAILEEPVHMLKLWGKNVEMPTACIGGYFENE